MLQYFRLKNQIQDTKTIVSFATFEDTRIDFSKKFLKKDSVSDRWYFTRSSVIRPDGTITKIVVFIQYGEVYIAECKDNGLDFNLNTIFSVQDIINYEEAKAYRGTQDAENSYRSAL